jgi:NADPH-dependent glutamate synthase beta subunit-like oxidoreductase
MLTTGTWRTWRPEYATRSSPCNLDCPAGTDVRAFIAHASEGDVQGAWDTIRRHNPLPAVCGRVCYHPCELSCNRGAFDEPIAIQAIERAIANEARRRRLDPEPIGAAPQARRVGVVGAGPAGLSCAYQLARLGYPVTVLDQNLEPGGMLRYGIPAYRLARPALAREIALLRRMGITFATGVRVGTKGAPDLSAFAAVFLAIGAQRSKRLRLPGETLPGVRSGLDLLHDVNAGIGRPLLGHVVVIGGGNTAIDAARAALRLGGEPTVVYRRSREDMPAHPDEVSQAASEGVRFVYWAAPTQFLENRGRVAGVELQRMRPGEHDASGRPRPEPIPGASFTLAADHVFSAIGEEVDVDALSTFAVTGNGRLRADRWSRTSRAAIFAGGDAATGAGTVVDAIGSGRRAASAIDAHLRGCDLVDQGVADRVTPGDLNLFYFRYATRAAARDRADTTTFDEVVTGLTWAQATAEARRCFTCGLCTGCDNCHTFCPDASVMPDRRTGTYTIDLTHCKGCGICVAECPRGAIRLVPEGAR